MADDRFDFEFNVKETGDIKRISDEYVRLVETIKKGVESIGNTNMATAGIWSKFNKNVTSSLDEVQSKIESFAKSGGDLEELAKHFGKINTLLRDIVPQINGIAEGSGGWKTAEWSIRSYAGAVDQLIQQVKDAGPVIHQTDDFTAQLKKLKQVWDSVRQAPGGGGGSTRGGGGNFSIATEIFAGVSAVKVLETAFEGLKHSIEVYAESSEQFKRVEIATHASTQQVRELTNVFMQLHAHTGATLESLTEGFIKFKEQTELTHESAAEVFKAVVIEADKAGTSVEAFSDIAVNAIQRFGVPAANLPKILSQVRSTLGPLSAEFSQSFSHLSMIFKDLGVHSSDANDDIAALMATFKELAEKTGEPKLAMESFTKIIEQMGNLNTQFGRRFIGDLERIKDSGGGAREVLGLLHEKLSEIYQFAEEGSPGERAILDKLGFTTPESRVMLRELIKLLGEEGFSGKIKAAKRQLAAPIEDTFSRQLTILSGNFETSATTLGMFLDKVMLLTQSLKDLNAFLEAVNSGKWKEALGILMWGGGEGQKRSWGDTLQDFFSVPKAWRGLRTQPGGNNKGGGATGSWHPMSYNPSSNSEGSFGQQADQRAATERAYFTSFRQFGGRGAAFTPGAGEAPWPKNAQVPPFGSGPYGTGYGGAGVTRASLGGGGGGGVNFFHPGGGGAMTIPGLGSGGGGGGYGGGEGSTGTGGSGPEGRTSGPSYGGGMGLPGGQAGGSVGGARPGGGGVGGGGGGVDSGPGPAVRGSVGGMSSLAADRARFAKELANNPALRAKVMRIAANEQGRNPQGTQAVLESMMNRASYMGTSLAQQAKWTGERGYYAMGSMGRGALENKQHKDILEHSLNAALGGSNISNYATDNASGDFARRRIANGMYQASTKYTGEYFVTPGWGPGKANQNKYTAWRSRMERGHAIGGIGQYAGGAGVSGGPTAEGGSNAGSYRDNMAFLRARGGHDARDDPNSTGGLTPEMAARLRAAGEAYEKETGQKANYGEMFRDMARQQRYYNAYRSGGGGLAAPPGRSRHQSGIATDVPRGGFRNWLAAGDKNAPGGRHAGKYGLEFLTGRSYAVDPVHVQMRRGDNQVFAKPQSGAEAKLPDAQKFRKELEKPIQMKVNPKIEHQTSLRQHFPAARQRRRQSSSGAATNSHRHGYHDTGPTALT